MTLSQVKDISFMLASNASYADVGANYGAAFLWPGAACTASTYTIYPMFYQGWTIKFARWVCAWNPNAPADSPSVVRLVHCDDGPSNIVEIHEFRRTYYTTPADDAFDFTSIIKPLWDKWRDAGLYKHIGHQTAGASPLIYQSRVELYLTPETP